MVRCPSRGRERCPAVTSSNAVRRSQRPCQTHWSEGAVDPACAAQTVEAFRRLRHETLSAERRALIALRNDGEISDDVLHRLEHELDVEALRLGIGERRAAR